VNVLAVGAHASSTLFLAGGTLARYAQAGHCVTIAEMCSATGERSGPASEELILRREIETRRAATLVPAEVDFLRLDLCGAFRVETRQRLTEVIRKIQPAVIITHDPADYCVCHTETGEMISECEIASRQHGLQTDHPPICESPSIAFMDTIAGIGFEPEEFVDITSVFELKCRMLACYEEETAAWQDHPVVAWLEWMGVHSRYRGIQAGVRYAEAFRRPHKWGHMRPCRILP